MSVVLATRRFQKQYPEFLRKYGDLEAHFRAFLDFRLADRYPDGTRLGVSSFNNHDGPVPGGGKFRRWHAIHGKAILLYQLHANEVRLLMLDEHKYMDQQNWSSVKQYAEQQTPADYYQFDINNPRPSSTTHDSPNDPLPAAAPLQTVIEAPPSPLTGHAALWTDRIVQYARDQQLLWEPRPARPLVVIRLDKDLLAPAGDAIVIDAATQTIFHLSRNELEAHFQPAAQATTDLGEALTHSMRPSAMVEPPAAVVEPAPQPEPEPELPAAVPEPEPELHEDAEQPSDLPAPAPIPVTVDKIPRRPSRLARLLVTMAHIQEQGDLKIDAATIRQYLPISDRAAVSSTLVAAQTQKYVRRLTQKGPNGHYYRLLMKGETEGRRLNAEGIVTVESSQETAAA